MRLSFAISMRYLRSPRGEGAISFITWIALFGVMLGVAALLVAMAVMNGYQANLVRVMSGALPHITLNPIRSGGLAAPDALAKEVRQYIHPVAISPFVMEETLVRGSPHAAGGVQGVMVRGIMPEVESRSGDFLNFLDDGSPDWKSLPAPERKARALALLDKLAVEPAPGVAPVLLSRVLARKLGVGLGDELTPMKIPEPGGGFSPHPGERRLQVTGFFETGLMVFDELVLVTHLKFVDEVLPGRTAHASLGIRLRDPLSAGAVAQGLRRLAKTSDHFFYVYSWLESNRGIFQVIRLQKTMLFIVLMLIVVIAFFGMVSALTVMVVEKTKEIAVLRSLGIGGREVMGIFVFQGLLIGVIGTVLGVALGLAICGVLDVFPLIDIPAGVYPGTDKIPVRVAWGDVLWIVGGTMAVCLVATLFPARKAGALRPVEGLRFG